MIKVALIPREGEHGVIMFFKGIKKKWFFRLKPEFTIDINESKTFDSISDAQVVIDVLNTGKINGNLIYFDDCQKEKYKTNVFWIIERSGGSYYSHDDIKRIGKIAKPIPQYTSDIMEADFMKSVDMVSQTLIRLRQSGKDVVRARMIYLTEKNDFTLPIVLFALTNKQTKKTRYLKGYDIDGKSSDRLYFVDSMEKAFKVSIPMAMKVVDDIHAKHKIFVVNTHIYDGTDTPASKFRYRKIQLLSDFKFKKN